MMRSRRLSASPASRTASSRSPTEPLSAGQYANALALLLQLGVAETVVQIDHFLGLDKDRGAAGGDVVDDAADAPPGLDSDWQNVPVAAKRVELILEMGGVGRGREGRASCASGSSRRAAPPRGAPPRAASSPDPGAGHGCRRRRAGSVPARRDWECRRRPPRVAGPPGRRLRSALAMRRASCSVSPTRRSSTAAEHFSLGRLQEMDLNLVHARPERVGSPREQSPGFRDLVEPDLDLAVVGPPPRQGQRAPTGRHGLAGERRLEGAPLERVQHAIGNFEIHCDVPALRPADQR